MDAKAGFFANLMEALRRSLADTFSIFDPGETSWEVLLAEWLTQLLVAIVLISLFLVGYLLLRRLLDAAVSRLRWRNQVEGPLVIGLRYVFFLLASLAIMAQLGLGQELLGAVARAALIALIFYVAWAVVTRVLLVLLARYELDRSIEQLLRNVISVVIVVVGLVTVLSQFGVDIFAMVAGLGIVGLAVGFAAQSTLANFIAGITLLLERPFRIGDWVRINDQEGKVIRIALRTTWLRTRDNIFTMIPNDSVASADIINYSTEGPTRLQLSLGIAYKESVQAARDVIMPILENHELVIQTPDMPPRLLLTALGDSSQDLTVRFWISPENYDFRGRLTAELLEAIKEALDEAGIEIPFPHLQLFIDDAKGLKPVVEPLYPVRREQA
ncbi:MAG: mechanosensitive ion channel family protein [Gammaproteobacteria bacterium]|nr:MAG: mechanosensitive ion channel family protein [Gammaproteobacteria bacterium]